MKTRHDNGIRLIAEPGMWPSPSALQAAVTALGYPLALESPSLDQARGYQACVLDGEDAGFTITQAEGEVLLRWSGDPREQLAALMVVAAAQSIAVQVRHATGDQLDAGALRARIADLRTGLGR